MEKRQLAASLWVGAQITEADIGHLAQDGFTDIVCSRPDAELVGGPTSKIIENACLSHGLSFHYHPITPGEPLADQADKLSELAASPDTKVFAYCRSGARIVHAWSLKA